MERKTCICVYSCLNFLCTVHFCYYFIQSCCTYLNIKITIKFSIVGTTTKVIICYMFLLYLGHNYAIHSWCNIVFNVQCQLSLAAVRCQVLETGLFELPEIRKIINHIIKLLQEVTEICYFKISIPSFFRT